MTTPHAPEPRAPVGAPPPPRYDRRGDDRRGSGWREAPDSPLAGAWRDLRGHWVKALVALSLTVGGLKVAVEHKADRSYVDARADANGGRIAELQARLDAMDRKLALLVCKAYPGSIDCQPMPGTSRDAGGVSVTPMRGVSR